MREDVSSAWDSINGVTDVGKTMWANISGQSISLGDAHRHTKTSLRSGRDIDEERDVARMFLYECAVANVVDTFDHFMKKALADFKMVALKVLSVITAFESAVEAN